MAIYSDLKLLFPKPGYNISYHRGYVSINETGKNVKVKEIKWEKSDFQYIDKDIIKDLSSFFQKTNSSDIFLKECDGIIFFEENGKKYVFLCELKSSFDTSDLYYAMHQIISSYIKLNMILHLLVNYTRTDYHFKAFIACLPPNKSYIPTLHKQLFLPSGSKYRDEADFSSELYVNKKVRIKPTDCEKLKGLNLGNNCLFNELTFHYIEVPDSGSINLDIHNYI